MDDQKYREVVHFLSSTEKKYPEYMYSMSDERKRSVVKSNFRQFAASYKLKSAVLVHSKTEKEVIQKSRVNAILQACHDNPTTGGHFGRDKTMLKITERFHWKGMKKDVRDYIKNCKKCFAVNVKMASEAPPLNSISVPKKVWSLVGIDIIGPLQETAKGNKYIVAITDHFSKWSEAAAIPDKTAASVADFVFSVVCHLGCMETLISDQGREFVNQVIDKLMDHFQCDHRISSAYHPQTNGQRERDNRTLKEALCKVVNEEGNNWDRYIPGVLFAYHTSVHASTKCTPFEVMYGRKARLPIDLKSENESDDHQSADVDKEADPDKLQTIQEIRRGLNDKVSESIARAQQHQKEQYDRRHHNTATVEIGTTVFIKNSRRIHRMGAKMEPRWTGPYTVIKSLDKGRVVLKNEKTNTVLKNTYHLANLKVYPCSEITSKINKDQEGATLPPRGVSAVRDGSKEPLPKRWTEMDCFKPISVDQRKTLAEALGLEVSKIIALGKYSELTQPRRLHRTKGDRNCYFRSISFVLTSSEDQHLKVRDRVVRHMSLIPIAEKIKAYSGQETAEYISASRMEDMGTWATDIEVVATANLLGCDIIVHSKYGEEMRWLRYPASFSLRQKTDTAIYLENRSDHFNVVLSVA
ncbi:hypothetical protein ACOMHN_042560 [Nucella lapillus]